MNEITVIGLGNYGLEELPYGIYETLQSAQKVYVRTLQHPVIEQLPAIEWHSFDDIYLKHDQFLPVYEEIVQTLVNAAQDDAIVYAVPGHPMVAETTTQLLLARDDVQVIIKGGKSFIDDLFTAVGYDPNDGFQMLDATDIHASKINVRNALIVTQVYNQIIAGDLKLTLMEKYSDMHPVTIITGASNDNAAKRTVALHELDHDFEDSNLTSLFVPPVKGIVYGEFEELNAVMQRLISPDGCPWDQQQTHQSLKRYLIEESFELMEAIDEDDIDHIIEELGDLLLQVAFHSALGEKEALFDSREVIAGITDKMIRRHPHVFGDASVETIEQLNNVWEQEKLKEGKAVRTVKMEKQFADLFMRLYEAVQKGDTLHEALRKEVNDETR